MKLSIILPTYNSDDTLTITLESIINQTYNNLEVWVIDGSSVDDTISIVKQYASKDDRIKWISEPDRGIYDAMNKGISLAQGKWIYFLGSDDALSESNILEKIFTNPEVGDFDVIYGNVLSSRFNGRYDGEFMPEKLYKKNICHQAIFFKKNIFKKTGNFNTKYKSHADWDHNIKWFLNNDIKKKYLPYDIANYSDGGFSSQNSDNLFEEDRRFNYIKYGFRSLPANTLWKLTYRELRQCLKNTHFGRIPFLLFVYIRSKYFPKNQEE